MQHVMVHIDPGLGPIGAWGYLDGDLTHFYPESLELSIPARGRTAMAARGDHLTVPEWFLILSGHPTAQDDFKTVEVNDGVSLPAVVAEFRKGWKQTTY